MRRPLLFLDVDGPLIPFGGTAREYPVARDVESSNPLLALVNPALGSVVTWPDYPEDDHDARMALVYTVAAGVGLVHDDIAAIATWLEAN